MPALPLMESQAQRLTKQTMVIWQEKKIEAFCVRAVRFKRVLGYGHAPSASVVEFI